MGSPCPPTYELGFGDEEATGDGAHKAGRNAAETGPSLADGRDADSQASDGVQRLSHFLKPGYDLTRYATGARCG